MLPACFAQQYNFTAPNIALLLIVLGISGTVVQGAGIAPLARLLGYKWLLVGGLVCTFANILLFAVVHLKWFVYVQIVRPTPSSPRVCEATTCSQACTCVCVCQGTLLALGTVCFPAISAIKSVNVSQSEQGTVQGALCTSSSPPLPSHTRCLALAYDEGSRVRCSGG